MVGGLNNFFTWIAGHFGLYFGFVQQYLAERKIDVVWYLAYLHKNFQFFFIILNKFIIISSLELLFPFLLTVICYFFVYINLCIRLLFYFKENITTNVVFSFVILCSKNIFYTFLFILNHLPKLPAQFPAFSVSSNQKSL